MQLVHGWDFTLIPPGELERFNQILSPKFEELRRIKVNDQQRISQAVHEARKVQIEEQQKLLGVI